MKKYICLTFFLLLIGAVLNAQTADEIQALLEAKAVSYAQAARFVLEAADVDGGQDAVSFAVGNKWLSKKAGGNENITLEQLSLLIMKAFDLKGGPMYSLFNSAHYSYRELVYMDIIQGRSDPGMNVSGEKMLAIINRLLYLDEESPLERRKKARVPSEEEQ